MKNKVESLKRSNPSEFFRRLKETRARPGEEKESSLKIQTHIEEDLSPEASANRIAKYFSDITKEIEPLDLSKLPRRVKEKLGD